LQEDVLEGVCWLWRHRLLRTLALLLAVINLSYAAGEGVLVLYTLEELDLGRLGYPLPPQRISGCTLTLRMHPEMRC